MFEYSPDHLAVIYRTNDPHSALALWTDQGINFPGLRRDRLQSSESVLPTLKGNLSLGEKHFENIVPEDDLYLFQFQRRSDT